MRESVANWRATARSFARKPRESPLNLANLRAPRDPVETLPDSPATTNSTRSSRPSQTSRAIAANLVKCVERLHLPRTPARKSHRLPHESREGPQTPRNLRTEPPRTHHPRDPRGIDEPHEPREILL